MLPPSVPTFIYLVQKVSYVFPPPHRNHHIDQWTIVQESLIHGRFCTCVSASYLSCSMLQHSEPCLIIFNLCKTILIAHIERCFCSHSKLQCLSDPIHLECSTPLWFVITAYQEKLDRSTPIIESLSHTHSFMKEDLSSKYQAYICQISNVLCSSGIRWQILPIFANFHLGRSTHHL